MRLFTIKDFLLYNNPCINCNKTINFVIGVESKNLDHNPIHWVYPTIVPKYSELLNKYENKLEIALEVSYFSSSTLILTIDYYNFFDVSNIKRLKKFLNNNSLFLYSECLLCNNTIGSENLVFNFDKKFIHGTTIFSEHINIKYENYSYRLNTTTSENKTSIFFNKKTDKCQELEVPLMYLYKFKDKQDVLNKLGTYITFS